MENYSIHLPSYSIGDKVYNKIPEICETYGKKIIAIGGHKAINAAREKIEKAILNLEAFPYSGHIPRYAILKRQGYRVLIVERHLIFYKVNDNEKLVMIYAVIDGRREYINLI